MDLEAAPEERIGTAVQKGMDQARDSLAAQELAQGRLAGAQDDELRGHLQIVHVLSAQETVLRGLGRLRPTSALLCA